MGKKRNWQRKKKFRMGPPGMGMGGGGGGGLALAPPPPPDVRIDYGALPADLSEQEVAELESTLPKPVKRARAAKPMPYDELQGLPLGDLNELAQSEKLENADGLRRLMRHGKKAAVANRCLIFCPILTPSAPAFLPRHIHPRLYESDYTD
jgi:hypothetical protein